DERAVGFEREVDLADVGVPAVAVRHGPDGEQVQGRATQHAQRDAILNGRIVAFIELEAQAGVRENADAFFGGRVAEPGDGVRGAHAALEPQALWRFALRDDGDIRA